MGTDIMKILRSLLAVTFSASILCSCATLQDTTDVDKFVERRDTCDFFRGEIPDPPNPERMKEVIDGANKYCAGTDAQLAALKIRYANNPTIMNKLKQYEPSIESDQ